MDLTEHLRKNEEYANQFFQLDGQNYTGDYCVLKLYVDEMCLYLIEIYKEHIAKHNDSLKNNLFPNAGFDLFVPQETVIPSMGKTFINLSVKCELIHCKLSTYSLVGMYGDKIQEDSPDVPIDGIETVGTSTNSGFYLYPRSSITKTDLMMTNHVGIIDSGYRGDLIASVRNLGSETATIAPMTRLFQVCHPSLCPIYVVLVGKDELTPTERGVGGFGSTGVVGATTSK